MSTKPILKISNWHVSVADKPVVSNLNLALGAGEVHVIMGPNGSGKSSLALSLLNHPSYQRTQGTLHFDDVDITEQSVDDRARKGLFLAFQNPSSITGVSVGNFLREAMLARGESASIRQKLYATLTKYGLNKEFAARGVNDGFSGGEKKRLELVQMQILEPRVVILDEIDSGLDIDGIKTVADGINQYRSSNRALIVITHYPKLVELIKPDFVHIMTHGTIVQTGDHSLALTLEKSGFEKRTVDAS